MILAPVPFGVRAAVSSLYWWNDEPVQIAAARSGLAGARMFHAVLACMTFSFASQGLRLDVAMVVVAWAGMSELVALLPVWAAVRFTRVHSGRFPGEDPSLPRVQARAQMYWEGALRDAEFARTGVRPATRLKHLDRTRSEDSDRGDE